VSATCYNTAKILAREPLVNDRSTALTTPTRVRISAAAGRDAADAREAGAGVAASIPSVGIVIPTYNEAENIARLIGDILARAPEARVIVVDDSIDLATAQAVEGLASPRVTVVHRALKSGRGSAVLEGIARLLQDNCAYIIEMDADYSHEPSELVELLREADRRGLDLLIASRYLPQSEIRNWPIVRRVFSKTVNTLTRTILKVPIVDYTNGYRVYSRRAAEVVRDTCGRTGKGFIALSESLVHLYYRGFQVGEKPTIFVNRARGESSVNVRELADACGGLI
jgi:dolichol-phosphate mannosyltransferase